MPCTDQKRMQRTSNSFQVTDDTARSATVGNVDVSMASCSRFLQQLIFHNSERSYNDRNVQFALAGFIRVIFDSDVMEK